MLRNPQPCARCKQGDVISDVGAAAIAHHASDGSPESSRIVCGRCSRDYCMTVDRWFESYPVPLFPDPSKCHWLSARMRGKGKTHVS